MRSTGPDAHCLFRLPPMSFDWIEYLQLAQHLMGQAEAASDEAKRRTAISRAYYAAYNEVRRLARQHGFQDMESDNHRALIEHCLRKPAREWKSIGENLRRLREQRNSADYKHQFDKIDYHTKYTLDLATSLLNQIKSLGNQQNPP